MRLMIGSLLFGADKGRKGRKGGRGNGRTTRAKRGSRQAVRRRRPILPAWLTARHAAIGAAVACLTAGAVWTYQTSAIARAGEAVGNALLSASAGAGLRIEEVLVEGRGRSDRQAVLDALGVREGTPIFAVSPTAAKARLEALPWVAEAAVERQLPDRLYVRMVERQPLALWQLNGDISLIDRAGNVIDGADPRGFTDLPLVVGSDAPAHALDLVGIIDDEPELKPLILAAVRVAGRRWNLRLQGGIDVRLPEGDPTDAWRQLARIQREQGILQRDVTIIDLRQPDRLIVRTAPDAPDAADRGENT